MLKRIAVVIWWIGALSFAVGAISTIDASDMGHRFAGVILGACVALCCFAGTYILGGTFLRPPAGPLSGE